MAITSQYVFDAHGNVLPASALAQRPDWPRPGRARTDYLVRNAGYILADHFGRHCRLHLNYKTASLSALAALAEWLLDHGFERVAVRQQGEQLDAILGDAVSAIAQISRHVHARDANGGAFLSKAITLPQLPAQHPFRDLIDLWRFNSSDHDLAEYSAPLHNLVDGRFIVSRVGFGSSLVFHSVGPGVQLYYENWYRSTVGLRVQDQPNYDLGIWSAEAYRETIIANEPRLDDVDIIVKRPRQPTKHICYKRVLLPLSGRLRGVLCATLLDPTVNLRFGVDQIPEDIVD